MKNELASASDLYVFSDGAKSEAVVPDVREVRAYLRSITGFKSITVVEREQNLGLAQSIIAGVSDVVARHGSIIVLEDDMVTSPYFLRFMNEALEKYRHVERVISIHGYVYPVREELPETFFLRGADCWGWATWKRGWDLFEPDGALLLAALKERQLVNAFDCNGAFPYLRMLKNQISGRNDSWAIRWHASAFLGNRLTLYPGTSLVLNIGQDTSGTHSHVATDDYAVTLASQPVLLADIPMEEHAGAMAAFERYFRSIRSLRNMLRKLLSLFK